jgi:penicillin-binding protein 1A
VFVGNEDRSARFKSITYGQGATAALPVWAYFMKLCYADENLKVSKGEFERPANLSIRVDCYNAPAAKKELTRNKIQMNSP